MEGGKYKILNQQPHIICSSEEYAYHLYVFMLPTLCLYTIVYPALILTNMLKFKRENKLDTPSAIYQQGFLFLGYNKNAYYWEFVKIYLRVLM